MSLVIDLSHLAIEHEETSACIAQIWPHFVCADWQETAQNARCASRNTACVKHFEVNILVGVANLNS